MKPKAMSIFILILLLGLFYYGSGNTSVDRIMENGAEVILNHLEPYQITGEPSTFDLEPILTIDMEREDLVREGIGTAGEFDVDAEGNIYVVAFKNLNNFIYRFNKEGELLNSFGKIGQGPGELSWPFLNRVFDDGRIALTDQRNKLETDLNCLTHSEAKKPHEAFLK